MTVASGGVGVTRVEHIMDMPIVVDVRDVDDAAALDRCSTGSASSTDVQHLRGRQLRSAGSTAATCRSRKPIRTCARSWRAVRTFAPRLTASSTCVHDAATTRTRPGSSRAGRSTGRPHRRRARLAKLCGQCGRGHPHARRRAAGTGVECRDPASERTPADRRRRHRRRPRGRNLRRIHPGRACRRPAYGATAGRCPSR